MATILGILNITRDSFSDGGRYLDQSAALAHARRLLDDGADVIDVGAASSHPDAEDVPADEQIARLSPVVAELKRWGCTVSVDACEPPVIAALLRLGADIINDITALASPESRGVLRESAARVILMHARHAAAAGGGRAERLDDPRGDLVAEVVRFFERRIAQLADDGIARPRLVLDPGMGFFLGASPAPSLTMLRNLRRLAALGCPVCVCTSRKSFIGSVLADAAGPRPVRERGAGTLATELWAIANGADWVRTHEPRPLRDALRLWEAIMSADGQC